MKKKAATAKPKKPSRTYDIKELCALVKGAHLPQEPSRTTTETSSNTPSNSTDDDPVPTNSEQAQDANPQESTQVTTPSTAPQPNETTPISTPRSQQPRASVRTNNSQSSPVRSSRSSQPLPSSRPFVPPQSSPSSTVDKRMPPPPVNWRPASQNPANPSRTIIQLSPPRTPPFKPTIQAIAEEVDMDSVVDGMAEEAQRSDAPDAKESMITGDSNQSESLAVEEEIDDDESRTVDRNLREGDDRNDIVPEGGKDVDEASSPGESSAKRKRSDESAESLPQNTPKKRKLKSDYCPAQHTSWTPAWLETTQCYPVDQNGEDMSDAECLNGDGIHRNADKLKRILEEECMYIPSHRVDEMMTIVEDAYNALTRTKEFYNEHPNKKIRIEKHRFN